MSTTDGVAGRGDRSSGDPIVVLHVDDEPEFLSMTATYLAAHYDDLTVESLSDPSTVLERIETGAVGCVVSDYSMPGMDGLELLAAVRDTHPRFPFVLYTGRGSEEIASEAIAAGVTAYVRKRTETSHYDLLVNRVRNATRTYRAQRRADRLEHVASVIRETNQVLLRAESRAELFADATATLSDADPYPGAWIGTVGDDPDHIESWTRSGGFGDSLPTDEDSVVGLAREAVSTETFRSLQGVPVGAADGVCSVAAVPLLSDDGCFGVLVVYGDDIEDFEGDERELLEEVAADVGFAVTAIALRERLQHRATELELLTRVLRHDVRNDIQVISGWCALLAEDLSGSDLEYVEKIALTSRNVAELTETAREIVEALATNGDAPLEPVVVTPILKAEVKKLRQTADTVRVSLIDHAETPMVLANEMLASVFRNVLQNAVEHADTEALRIDVSLTERDDYAVVRVADNGSGIPADRRETVFGKGERALDSSGTGMGLYLVATLVEQYGGHVAIHDNDPGAVVVVELPTV